MTFDNTKQRFENACLALLKTKCKEGKFHQVFFNRVIVSGKADFKLETILWMNEYTNHENELMASACLECLCRKGMPVSDFEELIINNLNRKIWCEKIIQMAELQKNPSVLLSFLDENSGYINRVVLALKKMECENYLTTLLLSDDTKLVKSINRIIKTDAKR